MKDTISYQRKIIGVEKKLGFLYIPVQGQEFMPADSRRVTVHLAGSLKASQLNYNAVHKRIFGLTKWYNKNKVSAGTILDVEHDVNRAFTNYPSPIDAFISIGVEHESLVEKQKISSWRRCVFLP